jgi:hypothetical protein
MAHDDLTDADLFDAAVSYSRRKGKLKAESDADPEKSRSTGMNFVLATAENRVIDRIPLDKLYRDAEKMQDVYLPDISKLFPVAGMVAIFVFIGILLNFCRSVAIKSSEPSDWLTDGSAWASCEVALKNKLRDPDSYQKVGEPKAVPTEEDGKAAWLWEFRSRNGFGGMNVAIADCVAYRVGQTVNANIMVQ